MAFKSTAELQSYIRRLDQSNIRLTRIELKYVAFNWFRRRILHALNSAIRFGAYKMRRLNRALKVANQLAIYNYNFTSGLGVTALNPAPHITIQRWQYLLDSAASEFWVWRNNHLVTMPPLWTKSFVYCNSSLSFLRSLFLFVDSSSYHQNYSWHA